MAEHKHAAVLRAIADGKEVEWFGDISEQWYAPNGQENPITYPQLEWRIKPEPKPDVVCAARVVAGRWGFDVVQQGPANLQCTFDGETGKLKSAEVLP